MRWLTLNIEDFEIFLRDFCEFLNGLEESIIKMKQQIAKLVGIDIEKTKKVAESQDLKAELQEAKADAKAGIQTPLMGEDSRYQGLV